MKVSIYRCFLPDLTGFINFHCAGPNNHCHLSKANPTAKKPRPGIQSCYSGLQVQDTANFPSSTAKVKMAERAGFEPARRYTRLPAFQASAFNQLNHLSVCCSTYYYILIYDLSTTEIYYTLEIFICQQI